MSHSRWDALSPSNEDRSNDRNKKLPQESAWRQSTNNARQTTTSFRKNESARGQATSKYTPPSHRNNHHKRSAKSGNTKYPQGKLRQSHSQQQTKQQPWRRKGQTGRQKREIEEQWDRLLEALGQAPSPNDETSGTQPDIALEGAIRDTVKVLTSSAPSNKADGMLPKAPSTIDQLIDILVSAQQASRQLHQPIVMLIRCIIVHQHFHLLSLNSNRITRRLFLHCVQHPGDTATMQVLCLMTMHFVARLAPEQTAIQSVAQVFLPVLEGAVVAKSTSCTVDVLQTMHTMFLHPQHVSSMMGSLIKDVNDEGLEDYIVNPLRYRILDVLQKLLCKYDDKNDATAKVSVVTWSCKALTACFTALHKLDAKTQSKHDLNPTVSSSVQLLATRIIVAGDCQENTDSDLRLATLHLLLSLLQYAPTKGVEVGIRLLLDSTSPRSTTSAASSKEQAQQPISPLFRMMRAIETSSHSQRQQVVACQLIASILDHASSKQLFGPTLRGSLSTSRSYHAASTSHGYVGRVVAMLESTISCIRVMFRLDYEQQPQHASDMMQSICKLLLAFFKKETSTDAGLLRQSAKLWGDIAVAIVDTTRWTPTIRKELATSLVATLGGQITPDGKVVSICAAAKRWLQDASSSSSSSSFISNLFDDLHKTASAQRVKKEDRDIALLLLTEIIKSGESAPALDVNRCQELATAFWEATNKEISFKVLSSVLAGRRKLLDRCVEWPAHLQPITMLPMIVPFLSQGIGDPSPAVTCLAASCYSLLTSSDWIYLDNPSSAQPSSPQKDAHDSSSHSHLRMILQRCSPNPQNSGKVRIAACKAVAEFGNEYFAFAPSIDTAHNHLSEIQVAMLITMNDSNPQVRSISLLAIGNAAHSWHRNWGVDVAWMMDTVLQVQTNLTHTNDKVVGNAIRALGHVSRVYAHEDVALYTTTLEQLTIKVSNALHAALHRDTATTMSWKQRSSAKKHGWGACNAMAHVLSSPLCKDIATLPTTISTLFECILHCDALNDKIVMAAMRAILSIPCNVFVDSNATVGAVLGHVIPRKSLRPLLKYLLACASISDACTVLKSIGMDDLQALYVWMVEEDGIPSHAFEIFALAMQRPGLRVEASIEQSFKSRALHEYKKEMTDGADTDANDGAENGDDDLGDEL